MNEVKFGLRSYSQERIDQMRSFATEKTSAILNRIQRYLDFKKENGRDADIIERMELM